MTKATIQALWFREIIEGLQPGEHIVVHSWGVSVLDENNNEVRYYDAPDETT